MKNMANRIRNPGDGALDDPHEGYRGEVGVILINHGQTPFRVEKGMKIAQMIVSPVLRVEVREAERLTDTARGTGGFGSTGA